MYHTFPPLNFLPTAHNTLILHVSNFKTGEDNIAITVHHIPQESCLMQHIFFFENFFYIRIIQRNYFFCIWFFLYSTTKAHTLTRRTVILSPTVCLILFIFLQASAPHDTLPIKKEYYILPTVFLPNVQHLLGPSSLTSISDRPSNSISIQDFWTLEL